MDAPHAIAVVTIFTWVLANVSVVLRLFARKKCSRAGMRSDDWFMVASLFFFNAFCAVIYALTVVERHNLVLSVAVADKVLLLIASAEAIFMVTSIVLKISLALFFLPFLVERKQQRMVLAITGIYCMASFVGIFMAIVPCGAPIHLADKRVEGKCIPVHVWDGLLCAHGVLSALSDWIFALLPIYTLSKSQLPRATKVSASILIVFAVCASVCAVVRTVFTSTLHFDAQYYNPRHRPTYYQATASVINCATLELGLGIATASLARLRPLIEWCDLPARFRAATRTFRREERVTLGKPTERNTWSSNWNVPASKVTQQISLGVIPSPTPSINDD